MICTHSLGRAARYFPERTALVSDGMRTTFRELHDRIASIAAIFAPEITPKFAMPRVHVVGAIREAVQIFVQDAKAAGEPYATKSLSAT